MTPLTKRELEILQLIIDGGYDTAWIQAKLCISRNTYRSHMKSIYEKLSVGNVLDAVLKAIKHGFVVLHVEE